MFEDGISSYVMLRGVVENNFPVDKNGVAHVTCEFCRYYGSARCRLTDEIVYRGDRYVGHECPLNKEEE